MIGFAVTLIVSIPIGNFHHFIHELILCLTFTNILGTGASLLFLAYVKRLQKSKLHKAIQFTILFLGMLMVAAVAPKASLWIGGYICGLDHFQVNRWHLAIVIVDFIVLIVINRSKSSANDPANFG